jgi:hypothetical protein
VGALVGAGGVVVEAAGPWRSQALISISSKDAAAKRRVLVRNGYSPSHARDKFLGV